MDSAPRDVQARSSTRKSIVLRGVQGGLFELTGRSEAPNAEFLVGLDRLLAELPTEEVFRGSAAEELYRSVASETYRKVTGQFFTPPSIARFMTRWVLEAKPQDLLDPSVGLGVFLVQAMSLSPKHRPPFHACDIDPVMVEATRRTLKRLGEAPVTTYEDDFVLGGPRRRFDGIVGNPPYVRHHTLDYAPDVFDTIAARHGVRLSRLTNIYGLFLLRCMELLSAHGRCALITPSEFLNADFGVALKRVLLESGKLSSLVLFEHTALAFDSALTTACITMVDSTKDAGAPVRLAKVSRAEQLDEVFECLVSDEGASFHRNGWTFQAVDAGRLDPTVKWDPLFNLRRTRAKGHLVPLGDIADSKRGVATGANNYFTLSHDEVREAELLRGELLPCIIKASTAPLLDFTSEDFETLRQQGKKIYLLNLRDPLSEAARRYVQLGEEKGIHCRYLTAARSPWYLTEKRDPAPVLVTVFAREGFRFVYNRTDCVNLTAYHCVYPRSLDEAQIKALMAYLTSASCARLLDQEKRVYGDGLIKLEPRDVLRVPVVDVRALPRAVTEELAEAFDKLCSVRRSVERWQETPEAERLEALVASQAQC